MRTLFRIYHSTLGKKYLMAVTGLALFVFVIAHMIGNLQIFLGREPLNAYAVFLKSKPALLWGARLGLLAVTALHIVSAVQLVRRNRAARPVKYAVGKPPISTIANRTLILSGLIILAFIIYHLLHFTLGVTNPEDFALRDPLNQHDVYGMVVAGFSNPLVSAFYIAAMALLCLHLSHGVSSMFQSLGIRNNVYDRSFDRFAKTAAAIIFIGNSAIPVAVLAGLVK
jgi:succinate dehydrogenase / fumarate reductase, cytochrome b subunit